MDKVYIKNEINVLRSVYMTEYFMERDVFRKIWYNLIDDNDMMFDAIEYGFESDIFKSWYNNETVYILHKDSGTLVCWYKLTHIGRCISSNKYLGVSNMYRFIRWFRNEVKDEIRR